MVLGLLLLLLCRAVAAVLAKINRADADRAKILALVGLFSLMKNLFIPCCCDFCSSDLMHVL